MKQLYESSKRYLDGPEWMRNEVDMWYAGASLFLQEVMRKKRMDSFGGLGEMVGMEEREKLEPVSVLDVCCGPGNFSNYVALFYPKIQVTGIDVNEEFLRSARERFGSYGWDFLKRDATNFDLGRKFDFILVGSGYHHIEDEDKGKLLKSVKMHLSEKGKIIVCENFLQYYADESSRNDFVNRYYEVLIEYYSQGNATLEAIDVIKEVRQLELLGEEEHKVHYQRFKQDVKQSGLEIEVDRIIWQPREFQKDNAGSHVLLIK